MQALTQARPTAAFTASRQAARRPVLCAAQPKQMPQKLELPALVKPAVLTAVSNIIMSMPAHAEAGKIFDFNLTLPIMMGEFLLLMVFLDKAWFGPIGRTLDERDAKLRSLLSMVKDNGSEIAKLQDEAQRIISEARSAAQKQVADAKAVVAAECAKELAEAKAKVDAELSKALATLETEKEAALKGLDSQVDKLSADILARVLPEGVRV